MDESYETMMDDLPILSNILPDIKTCLHGEQLDGFFLDKTLGYQSLLNKKLDNTVKIAPKLTNMKDRGIDAVYIDNILSKGILLYCFLVFGTISPCISFASI